MKAIKSTFVTVTMNRDELLEIIEKHVKEKSPVEYDGLTVEDISIDTKDETDKAVKVYFADKGEEI